MHDVVCIEIHVGEKMKPDMKDMNKQSVTERQVGRYNLIYAEDLINGQINKFIFK